MAESRSFSGLFCIEPPRVGGAGEAVARGSQFVVAEGFLRSFFPC